MSKYDQEYFIMFLPAGDEQIYLKPNSQTAKRKYHYKQLTPGEAPLFFQNSYRDEDKNQWPITNVLVDMSGLLVTPPIHDEIKNNTIDFMQTYPAVYVDDKGNYHEEYWYIGFYDELQCLDVKSSTIETIDFDEDDEDDDDEERLEVEKYSLDEGVLDAIKEENRLMFKIAGCSKKHIFVHSKIVDIFGKNNATGIRFLNVASFEEGDQFRP
ncbi:MAG: hypothetical protein JKX76_03520 [Colwellia sp.]|nr:hypothetical protein [Colwellia sp.]